MNTLLDTDRDGIRPAELFAADEFSGGWRPQKKPFPDPTCDSDDDLMIIHDRQSCYVL